ncbi:MAG: response regulator [Bacteroidales bacterium]|nr:response regulator [Bacteroidales bacterium]MCF8454432.1 response regulator [Bacteroidales bacterium]
MRQSTVVFYLAISFLPFITLANNEDKKANEDSWAQTSGLQIETLLQKGRKYLHLDLFEPAFVYADSALKLATELEQTQNISESLLLESKIYVTQKKYTEALNTYFQLIYYLNSTHNIIQNKDIYRQIAVLYTKLQNYDKAIIYYNKSMDYAGKSEDKVAIAKLLLELGDVLMKNREFENAEATIRKAIEASDDINDQNTLVRSYIKLAISFDLSERFQESLSIIEETKKYLGSSTNDTLIADYYFSYANILFHTGNFTLASNLSLKSLEISRRVKYSSLIKENLTLLQEMAISKAEYPKALQYANEFNRFLIEESNQELGESSKDHRIVYEMEQQERELERLRLLEVNNENKLRGRKQLIVSLIAIGFLSILIALMLYYRGKGRKKAMEIEAKQNQQINKQNQKLEQVNKDLSEAKAAAEFARDTAVRSDKAKTAFLDIMSHEIRTPISGIIGMINVLKDIDLDDDKREKLLVIEQSSNDLLDIFNDILEFIKLESGNLGMEPSDFNLRNALQEVQSIHSNRAAKRGLDFSVNIDEAIPEVVYADEARLKQVLKSLLSNAVKFTQKGSVQLNFKYVSSDEKRCQLRVEVIDSGIGMNIAEIKNIFTAFSPAHTSFSREYHGIGLSLAIVKKLVHLMNSAIQVESSKGIGSRFWFDLDIPYSEKSNSEDESLVLSEAVKFKILLAEDNELMQKVGAANLAKYGEVDIAPDGAKAFEMYKNKHYDIIVMDLQMPNVNGWEATILIREFEKQKGIEKAIPIIALTANVSQKDRKKSFDSGMDFFAEKPIRPEVLDQMFAKLQYGEQS